MTKKKLLYGMVLFVFVVVTAIILLNLFLFPKAEAKIVGKDDYNRLIIIEGIPYYYYIEGCFFDDDADEINKYSDKIYSYREYELSEYQNGVCINAYYGDEKEVVIPETIGGKKVVALGNHFSDSEEIVFTAFEDPYGESIITSIHIPSGVKYIANGTFSSGSFTKLKTITVDKDNPYYYSFCGMLFSKETNELLCAPMFNYHKGYYFY